MTGHAGVHLYKDILAILSIQNQTVYMFKLVDGKLIEHRTIGYHNNEDDEAVLESHEEEEAIATSSKRLRRSSRYPKTVVNRPKFIDGRFSGIKQRLMSYLYRRARDSRDGAQMQHFCMVFDLFSKLVMWRVHFLDDKTLLFKFGTIDNVMYRQSTEPITNQIVFFVTYCMETTLVTGVYESSSPELFRLYTSSDKFRGHAFDEKGLLHFI